MRYTTKEKGFTLGEILVAIGLLGLLATLSVSGIKKSKEKSADLEVKKTLSEIQVKVQDYDIAPGVVDYQGASTAYSIPAKITTLATKFGVQSSNYSSTFNDSAYAVVFPLKASTSYYCVDSMGNAKEVVGLLNTTGEVSCNNATRVATGGTGGSGGSGGTSGGGGGSTNTPPVITLNDGSQPGNPHVGYPVTLVPNSGPEGGYIVSSADWPEPSYTAYDAEDGNITNRVVVVYPEMEVWGSLPAEKTLAQYVKTIFTPTIASAKGSGGYCLAMVTRHYKVTDSHNNTVHAYRYFTSVC